MKPKSSKKKAECTGTLSMRMSLEIKDKVYKKAKSLGLTISSYLNELAEEDLENNSVKAKINRILKLCEKKL